MNEREFIRGGKAMKIPKHVQKHIEGDCLVVSQKEDLVLLKSIGILVSVNIILHFFGGFSISNHAILIV
jgi:hypothetical protein